MLQGIYDLTSEWARGQQIEVLLSCSDNIGTINWMKVALETNPTKPNSQRHCLYTCWWAHNFVS